MAFGDDTLDPGNLALEMDVWRDASGEYHLMKSGDTPPNTGWVKIGVMQPPMKQGGGST
jgi:hypothetical protein